MTKCHSVRRGCLVYQIIIKTLLTSSMQRPFIYLFRSNHSHVGWRAEIDESLPRLTAEGEVGWLWPLCLVRRLKPKPSKAERMQFDRVSHECEIWLR